MPSLVCASIVDEKAFEHMHACHSIYALLLTNPMAEQCPNPWIYESNFFSTNPEWVETKEKNGPSDFIINILHEWQRRRIKYGFKWTEMNHWVLSFLCRSIENGIGNLFDNKLTQCADDSMPLAERALYFSSPLSFVAIVSMWNEISCRNPKLD